MQRPSRFARWPLVLALVSIAGPALARGEAGTCRPIAGLPASITEAGAYCLSGDLATPAAQGFAIRIMAEDVVLDLNGFTLAGHPPDRRTTTTFGILATGGRNITVRNGTVRGFFDGISMVATGVIVENIRADDNTHRGIFVGGPGNIVRNNQVLATGGTTVGAGIPEVVRAIAISVVGAAPRVLNNDVTGLANENTSPPTGIFLINVTGALVVGNRIAFVDTGIEFSTAAVSEGKYRDNLTVAVGTPYVGGTDAGNNQ